MAPSALQQAAAALPSSPWWRDPDWLSAIATVAAVLVALFKDDVLAWWHAPSLKLEVSLAPSHCHRTKMGEQTYWVPVYFFRMLVINEGKSRATSVQVHFDRLTLRNASGDFVPVANFLPMNLKWSHDGKVFAEGISPKMTKFVDFGHIHKPDTQQYRRPEKLEKGKTWLTLTTEVATYVGADLLVPGTYQATLLIAAANAKPSRFVVEFSFQGNWFDDEREMFQQEVGFKLVSPRG